MGPQLCSEYVDEKDGRFFLFAMEPLTRDDGELRVFGRELNSDGRKLCTIGADRGISYFNHVIFVQPRIT